MSVISPRAVIASVANFLALGGGTGLAPIAPGTFGTLIGIPVFLVMPKNIWIYLAVLCVLFAVGVWCCQSAADYLQVHDHPGIVWDEVVGYLVTMIAVPKSLIWIVVGFIVFRFFDILKPWPISYIDREMHGGLGIMLDDVVAALFAAITMQILIRLIDV